MLKLRSTVLCTAVIDKLTLWCTQAPISIN